MFAFQRDIKDTKCGEGVTRKILGSGGNLMLVEVKFAKGAVGEVHTHIHEQVSYIVEGAFEFHFDGDKKVLQKGDSVYVPSNVPHGVVALEENSVIVDVFTPQREDFLQK